MPLQQRRDHSRCKVVGTSVSQRASRRFTHGGPKAINNHGVMHKSPWLIPKRFAVLQHELNPGLALLHAAERKKCFSFQVQQILLANRCSRRCSSPAKYVRQLLANDEIVVTDHAALA